MTEWRINPTSDSDRTCTPVTSNAARAAPAAADSPGLQTRRGNSHKPPQSPCGGRRPIKTLAPSLTIAQAWRTFTVARPGGKCGQAVGSDELPAMQLGCKGQESQRGSDGMQ